MGRNGPPLTGPPSGRVGHVGRSTEGHIIEDGCACPTAPCGLVIDTLILPSCVHHSIDNAPVIRQFHWEYNCPATNPTPVSGL